MKAKASTTKHQLLAQPASKKSVVKSKSNHKKQQKLIQKQTHISSYHSQHSSDQSRSTPISNQMLFSNEDTQGLEDSTPAPFDLHKVSPMKAGSKPTSAMNINPQDLNHEKNSS